MWTWRRKEPGSPPETPSPATLPVTRAEWRSLPPIQRAVAEHPLINPVRRFSSSLTSWQSPAYLEPLGHRVGPAEPSGVIDGLARTAETPVPDLPVVQRSARKRGVLSRLWGMSVQRAAEPDAPEAESLAPEPDAPASSAATAQPLPEAFEPTAALVLPAVAAAPREAGRPSMPLTSAGPSMVPDRPPVRTVQAIRAETPSAPQHTPEPAVELPSTPSGPIATEPDPVVAETVPVEAPDPLPAADVVTSRPVEPPRPALPVVQRTEQVEAVPRRLGLGAPILPDPGPIETPVPPVPVVENDVAEADAPLAGDVETSVLPAEPAAPAPVADEVPRPVARMVAGEEWAPPATAVETTVTTAPVAARGSDIDPVRELPAPDHREVPRSGASVRSFAPEPARHPVVQPVREKPQDVPSAQEPVQRLRDDEPVLASRAVESPAEPEVVQRSDAAVRRPVHEPPGETSVAPILVRHSAHEPSGETPVAPILVSRAVESSPKPDMVPQSETSVRTPVHEPPRETPDAPILVSRASEPPPGLTTVTSSRSSPGTTVHLPESPRIRSGTTETSEPPGTPGGSVGAPPAAATSTSPLPVARVVDGTVAASPTPEAVDRPTLAALTGGGSAATPLPELPVSRVIEAPPITNALPSARVVDVSAPPAIQRAHEPSPQVAETLTATKVALPPVVQRNDAGASPWQALPRAGTAEPGGERTGPLPVARTVEAVNGERSTMDVLRTARRAAPSENGLVLDLPPVVVPRPAEVPAVQREPEASPPEPVAPPAAAPVPVPATAGPAAPAAQPETEELVKKLFDPLLRRLKTELRLDRERRGALTDRPH
ncbi:hypothetical protein [Amycolatopsis sp. EV170708-02-1]|uniref:hypothetical protein n=1 Tax=Amycolatopsis sp. EV170708-02-1 TaxID=2919322 RepID=UPI001F0C755B|nr:hypothetical protein [Amycolatopsis sp. EV170708-02-1]UMP03468.1 hypothetical protein MJQ72_00850 [Amycolatopsis sp. EV170708-02-1]